MDLFTHMNNTKQPKTRLLEAVSYNNIDELDRLLNDGIDPNLRLDEFGGNTAVHIAALKGHDQCVRRLLLAGANGEAPNDTNITPLISAARNDHTQVMEVILKLCKCNDCYLMLAHYEWQVMLKEKNNDKVITTLICASPDLNATQYRLKIFLKPELLEMCYRHPKSLSLLFYLGYINSEDIKVKLQLIAMNQRVLSRLARQSERRGLANPLVGMGLILNRRKDPSSLQHFCKLAIRKSFHGKCNVYYGVQQLPVPDVIKDGIIYVSMK